MNKSTYLLWRNISHAIKATSFLIGAIAYAYGYWTIIPVAMIAILGNWYLLDYVSRKYIEELEDNYERNSQ